MLTRILIVVAAASMASAIAGCGSSEPVHEVKPITARPVAPVDAQNLKTPEEKIKYIQNSNAPESEKKKAIAQVQAGQL